MAGSRTTVLPRHARTCACDSTLPSCRFNLGRKSYPQLPLPGLYGCTVVQFRYCPNLVPKSCGPFDQRQRMRKTYRSGDERLARPWRAKAPDDRALQKCKIWGCALSIARDDRWSVINTDPPSLNVMWVLKAAQFPANSSMCVLQFLRW